MSLAAGEMPGAVYLSALLKVEHLQSNSILKLSCAEEGSMEVMLRLGDHSGPLRAQQLAPNQVFISFDTGAWQNGCTLRAVVANGVEGESAPYRLGTLVLLPRIERVEFSSERDDHDSVRASFTVKTWK